MIKILLILVIVWFSCNVLEGFTIINHNQFHCPQVYRKNMKDLETHVKKMQYGGYTENEYLDITRFVNTESEPLPVNPDFFK